MDDDRRVIVIGSGPSGAMAALTLVEQGIPVTMLESGQQLPRGLLVRLMGKNVLRRRRPLRDRTLHVASGDPDTAWYSDLVPGGMSNYWTGAVPRFAPEDFHEGERLHERYRWPVTYDDVAPYYERVERLLKISANPRDVAMLPAPVVAHPGQLPRGWDRVSACASAHGQSLTPVPLADGQPWIVTRTGVAFNSFTKIVRPLQQSPLFELVLGAHALRLEWCGARRRVTGVTYYDRDAHMERQRSCAAVIVAAGPLLSTKLLLHSTSADFPDGLGNTEGLLGHYLHDHAHDMCVIGLNRPIRRLSHAAYLTRAPYHESPPLLAASCTIGATATLDKILSVVPLKTNSLGVVVFGTMVPIHDNFVRLDAASKDELGLPKLDIHIRYDEDAARTTAAARERLLGILESAGYRGQVRWSLPRMRPGSSVHYGGTVRMHESARHGVLDGWNRMHAVDNVVVADASSFTTGVEKNPTLTAMALAARSASRLAADLKAG